MGHRDGSLDPLSYKKRDGSRNPKYHSILFSISLDLLYLCRIILTL